MASTFKNTAISGTSNITLPNGTTAQRTAIAPTIVTYTSGSGSWTVPSGVNTLEVLVVAGGGGGGGSEGGGGGGGGVVYNGNYAVTPGATISYSVGAGGAGSSSVSAAGSTGSNSTFGTITAYGGGGGGCVNLNTVGNGGSGGGGGRTSSITCPGGTGTTGQGFAGGTGYPSAQGYPSAGGGGAGGKGGDGIGGGNTTYPNDSGGGGNGLCFDISGTPTWYGGGGGGGGGNNNGNPGGGAGGLGGGGNGGPGGNVSAPGSNGTANTGGGGGGAGQGSAGNYTGGTGGSGIVIIKYYSTADATDPRGMIRYNTSTNNLESWDGPNSWRAMDPRRNLAGHNIFSNSSLGSFSTGQRLDINAASGVADPFGGTGTYYLQANTTSNTSHSVYKQQNGNASTTMTFSVFAKADASGRNVGLYVDGITNGIGYVSFDLATGASTVVTSQSGLTSYGSQSYGNGWWRCWITGSTTGSGSYYFHIDTNSGTSQTFADTVGNGIYAFGAQMEQASYPGPYTMTTGVATPIPTALVGYNIHAFTTTGTTYWSPTHTGIVEVLVVAGGGGGGGIKSGGTPRSAGGGGGGVIYNAEYPVVAGKQYVVTVGAGGAAGGLNNESVGTNGGNSQFGSLLAIGGGGGGCASSDTASNLAGRAGGSGGGGGSSGSSTGRYFGGPGVKGQGYQGGTGEHRYGTDASGAGGGGAGGPGQNGGATIYGTYAANGVGGAGGPGVCYDITGYLKDYGGGGAGGSNTGLFNGGSQGGGSGNYNTSATANTGGGGGGTGGAGGSGVVVVRYLTSSTTYTPDGSTANNAASSALAIKNLTGTTTDGLYWINVNGTATQVYCDMNTAGGGWMHCGTFADGGEATNNANHIWGAPLNPTQDTGIWQNTTTTGSQSFTADYKNNVWVYYPMTQMLMKDSGASLRNLWYTATIPPQSLSTFFGAREWRADGSVQSYGAMTAGQVHIVPITNFGINDAVFGSSSLNKILFKYGERDGAQDGNKDRAMISYETSSASDVDTPKGIGCFTNRGGTINYRDVVPIAQNTSDWPPDSITGTHYLTLWVR